jgi:hypothetical protein
MYIGLYVKCRYSCPIELNLKFLDRFSKNFKSARPVGAELFQADGRTDMTKLTVTFRNFASTHKNQKILLNIGQHDTPPSSGEVVNEYSYASRLQLYLFSPFCLHGIIQGKRYLLVTEKNLNSSTGCSRRKYY